MACYSIRLGLGFLLLVGCCMGCNLMALPFFLMPGMEPKHEAKCRLASEDKEKEVKAVIIAATSSLETRPEFLRVDRDLSRMMLVNLEEGFKRNKEKVKMVPVSAVEEYKNQHPNWRSQDLHEVGQHFGADYVISLEIDSITLYEKGSANMLFSGHSAVSISVIDARRKDDGEIYKEEFTCNYPRARGPIPVGDSNPAQFKQKFLSVVARELSWRFTAHPTADDHACD